MIKKSKKGIICVKASKYEKNYILIKFIYFCSRSNTFTKKINDMNST